MITELRNRKIKYLHIMIVNSAKHNGSVIRMINSREDVFQKEDHVFIVTDKELYNELKNYDNVYYDNTIITQKKSLQEYAKASDYIFFHSLNIKYSMLFHMTKKVTSKVIWIVWGHDIYRKKATTPKSIVKEMIYQCTKGLIKKYKVKQFSAIGVGFKYDIIEIRRKFGQKIRILPLLYGYEKDKKTYTDEIANEKLENNNKDVCKIMIGHCAYPFLNHIKIMNELKRFKDENILITLVLSYGDMEYAKQVEEFAIREFGKDKVEIIKDMMTDQQYLRYLKTIDICILDYKHQAALGNLWRLLYLEKKVYLNKDGILKLASDFEGAETYTVDLLPKLDFKEFSKKLDNPKACRKSAEFYMDEENILMMWKNTLREIENDTSK